MRSKSLFLLLLITLVFIGVSAKNHSSRPKLRRNDFLEDFIFGSATSAFQCEGAAHEDGRGPSIWDSYSENFPEKILDGSNGSVADDSYNLYKEDVSLLHQIGFSAYRFSISWSRILPHWWFVLQLTRLFVGEPVWTPYNRPQEDHPVRQDYIQGITHKFGETIQAH